MHIHDAIRSCSSNRGLAPILCTTLVATAGAAIGDTIVDFDYFPDGTPVLSSDQISNQWASWGVTFSSADGGPIGHNASTCSYSLPNHVGAYPMIARFRDPLTGGAAVVQVVGSRQDWCWAPGEGLDMKAFNSDGELVASHFSTGAGTLHLFTMDSPVIAELQVMCYLQGVDDFQFSTPIALRPADVNGDNTVNAVDLGILLGAWGTAGPTAADVNRSGMVDAVDLALLIGDWG
ncbi:MAG: hypothetical protein JNL80_03835 [Phycisphaerae bacterium]|nr:hypothetical protein [Phycisphaerae bacterium]